MMNTQIKEKLNPRIKMPDRRKGYIQKVTIGNHKLYLHTGILMCIVDLKNRSFDSWPVGTTQEDCKNGRIGQIS